MRERVVEKLKDNKKLSSAVFGDALDADTDARSLDEKISKELYRDFDERLDGEAWFGEEENNLNGLSVRDVVPDVNNLF